MTVKTLGCGCSRSINEEGEVVAMELFFKTGEFDAAVGLVKKYHYSHRAPGNVQFVGTLHVKGGLFGDFGEAVAACFFSSPPTRWSEEVLELTRLVRTDNLDAPLTSLISQCLKRLKQRKGIDLLVSFADSTQDHHGGIYQAASWTYDGRRDASMDGLIVNGEFHPGRSCNALWGTRSPSKLQSLHPGWNIEPHFDLGKHLYWKVLKRQGRAKADRLGLKDLPYPKPDIADKVLDL